MLTLFKRVHRLSALQPCAAICWSVLATLLPAHAQSLEIPGANPPEQVLPALAEAFNQRHAPAGVVISPGAGQSGALHAVNSGRATLDACAPVLAADER